MSDAPAEDDLTIMNGTLLHRWLPRDQIVPDANLGRYRPSTNAFQKTTNTDGMSVVLGDALAADGRTPSDLVSELRTVASLTAGFVRSCDQVVVRDPIDNEPAHGNVVGPDSRGLRKKLACEASCVEGEWESAKRDDI